MEKIPAGVGPVIGGEGPDGNWRGAGGPPSLFQACGQGGQASLGRRWGGVDGVCEQGPGFRGGTEREQHSCEGFGYSMGVFVAALARRRRLEKPEAQARDDARV